MNYPGGTFANGKFYVYDNNSSTTGYTYEYTIPTTTTTYNPVEINKLSTYYALSVGPNYNTNNMDNSGNLIVEGNVGIGLSNPSGYKLEVVGDISFNGNLYQNGTLFQSGSGGGVQATSITKQGQVLETLAGVCDGRTVVVESGSYTLPNVTTSLSLTSTYTTVTGSEISYTPPPNTKQVIYIFKTMYSRDSM